MYVHTYLRPTYYSVCVACVGRPAWRRRLIVLSGAKRGRISTLLEVVSSREAHKDQKFLNAVPVSLGDIVDGIRETRGVELRFRSAGKKLCRTQFPKHALTRTCRTEGRRYLEHLFRTPYLSGSESPFELIVRGCRNFPPLPPSRLPRMALRPSYF